MLAHLGVYDWKKESERLQTVQKKNSGYVTSSSFWTGAIEDIDAIFQDEKYDNLQQRQDPYSSSSSSYSQIIMLNSGNRGPFFVNDDDFNTNNNIQKQKQQPITTWIDYVAMGGRSKIPNPRLGFFHHKISRWKKHHEIRTSAEFEEEAHECPIHVASGTTISWQQQVHIQSFFLAAPAELVRTRIFPLFVNSCNSKKGGKQYCIAQGEVQLARAVLQFSPETAVYSLGRQFHLQEMVGTNTRRKKNNFWVPPDGSYYWYDPAKSIFVKNGGHLSHDGLVLQKSLVNAVDRLTVGASLLANSHQEKNNNNNLTSSSSSRSLAKIELSDLIAITKMMDEKKCEWNF